MGSWAKLNKVCKCCLSRNSWSIGAGNYGLLRRRDDGSGVVSGTRNLGENVITIGSGVPGIADTLSDFTGVNLRTLDIALLMCYDEKQKVVAEMEKRHNANCCIYALILTMAMLLG